MSTTLVEYIVGQVVILTGVILTYLGSRTRQQSIQSDVQGVHTLVNGRSDAQDARIDQLTSSLTGAGVSVPPTPAQSAADERLSGGPGPA